MESAAALSGLTSLITSNVTNGWFQIFADDDQKTMLHIAILSFVGLFSCCVSASILQSNTNREAVGLRCFQGMITIFSVISVAMLSASMLPGYFKYISYFFCCIPVIVHTISDKRWFRDWFSKTSLVLAWYHQRW